MVAVGKQIESTFYYSSTCSNAPILEHKRLNKYMYNYGEDFEMLFYREHNNDTNAQK